VGDWPHLASDCPPAANKQPMSLAPKRRLFAPLFPSPTSAPPRRLIESGRRQEKEHVKGGWIIKLQLFRAAFFLLLQCDVQSNRRRLEKWTKAEDWLERSSSGRDTGPTGEGQWEM